MSHEPYESIWPMRSSVGMFNRLSLAICKVFSYFGENLCTPLRASQEAPVRKGSRLRPRIGAAFELKDPTHSIWCTNCCPRHWRCAYDLQVIRPSIQCRGRGKEIQVMLCEVFQRALPSKDSVADQLAATAGEDGRTDGQTRPPCREVACESKA